MKKEWKNNPEFREKRLTWLRENKELVRKYTRNRNRRLRLEILQKYGGIPPKCKCCDEKIYEFLAVDHINNDGYKERKSDKSFGRGGTAMYLSLKRRGFPKGYQILCHNCNLAKGFYGECPHVKINN